MKKRTLTIVIALIALAAVVLPVAAQGNGWALEATAVYAGPGEADCVADAYTGEGWRRVTIVLDITMPPVPFAATVYGDYLDAVEVYQGDSVSFVALVGPRVGEHILTYTLDYRGVTRTAEVTVLNNCQYGGIVK